MQPSPKVQPGFEMSRGCHALHLTENSFGCIGHATPKLIKFQDIKIRDEITHDMRLGRLLAKDPFPLDTQLAQAVGIGDPSQIVSGDDAKTHKHHSDLPVFVAFAVDSALDGHPISTSRDIWPAARVTFAMEQGD